MNKAVFILCLMGLSLGKAQISEQNLEKTIHFLAADKMEGRQTGSRQAHKVSKWIEKEFKKLGLKPKGEKGFRQSFTAKVSKVKIADSIRKADNIIGFLDNGAARTIVVGAHYDHIGHGELGNSKDDPDNIGKIHNGADDNASGVAGLLELARLYTQNDVKERYNILFIAFGAEELGLYGSRYFTEHPTIPLDSILWMLNMDMIGRYNPDNGLMVIGYGTSPAFKDIFEGVTSDIKFRLNNDGRGGSDQTSFYDKKIPVLFFHTGGHEDYHKHGDDADKINYKAMKSILELEATAIDHSMREQKMEFTWTN